MKYIYYYLWLTVSSFEFFMVRKPIFWFFKNVISILKLKNRDEKIKKHKEIGNRQLKLDFPDCVSLGVFRFFIFIIVMLLLFPSIVFVDYFVKKEYGIIVFILVLVLISALIIYWFDYIEKRNKEWLRKKINNKKKDFYL